MEVRNPSLLDLTFTKYLEVAIVLFLYANTMCNEIFLFFVTEGNLTPLFFTRA